MARKGPVGRRFLTTTDVARYCEVSNDGVLKWIKTGKLRAFATPGGHYRVSAEDFRAFLSRYEFPIQDTYFAAAGESPRATRILVVHADATARAALQRRLLKINPRWVVDQAADCGTAGIKIGSRRPNVVILDLGMPGLDTFSLCNTIRSNPETRRVRIVAISPHRDETICQAALKAGADACVTEPLDSEQFRGDVLRLIALPRREQSTAARQSL